MPGLTDAEDGSCKECSGNDVLPFTVAVIAALLCLAALYYFSTWNNPAMRGLDALWFMAAGSTLVVVVQTLGVMDMFAFTWGEPARSVLAFMRLFVFDIEVLQPGCVVSISP